MRQQADGCTWCGHPAHDPTRCRHQVAIAAEAGGTRLPRRWGDKTIPAPCPCANHNERNPR